MLYFTRVLVHTTQGRYNNLQVYLCYFEFNKVFDEFSFLLLLSAGLYLIQRHNEKHSFLEIVFEKAFKNNHINLLIVGFSRAWVAVRLFQPKKENCLYIKMSVQLSVISISSIQPDILPNRISNRPKLLIPLFS